MGPQGVGITTSSDNRRRGISDRRRVKIGTHLLKSTDQGLMLGVLLDSGNLISNASISDLVLQRVGVDHVVVLVSYDETTKVATFRDEVDPGLFDHSGIIHPCCRHVEQSISNENRCGHEWCCRDSRCAFHLSANLRYQLTQTVNVFRDSLQAD
jgi:hypothetical protein